MEALGGGGGGGGGWVGVGGPGKAWPSLYDLRLESHSDKSALQIMRRAGEGARPRNPRLSLT